MMVLNLTVQVSLMGGQSVTVPCSHVAVPMDSHDHTDQQADEKSWISIINLWLSKLKNITDIYSPVASTQEGVQKEQIMVYGITYW